MNDFTVNEYRRTYPALTKEKCWTDCTFYIRQILVDVFYRKKDGQFKGKFLSEDEFRDLDKNWKFIDKMLTAASPDEVELYCASNGIDTLDWKIILALIIGEPVTVSFRGNSSEYNYNFVKEICQSTDLCKKKDLAATPCLYACLCEVLDYLQTIDRFYVIQLTIRTFLEYLASPYS